MKQVYVNGRPCSVKIEPLTMNGKMESTTVAHFTDNETGARMTVEVRTWIEEEA